MIIAIHVDDDPRSIELMKLAADEVADLDLKASFLSGASALEWLAHNNVDIIFLDVEMPEKNGLDLANELAAYSSDVIFVTAHTGFAIKAFEACALDYLVKPIYAEKLRSSLERYLYRKSKLKKESLSSQVPVKEQVDELINNYMSDGSYPRRIFVSMVGEIRVINLDDVIYFGASGPYTKIYLTSGEIVTCSESIKLYSESLEKHPGYVRIHRSYLINKQYISSILRKPGNISVKMSNGDTLGIAQQRRAEIFQQIAT
ncbi:MAG TPA: LytTR family DNA-binding domain-containing protein [Flavisolibacter sp.]|nr:LytTR family DNA-binding domain-containing protein [Flavisolibacter sp.]